MGEYMMRKYYETKKKRILILIMSFFFMISVINIGESVKATEMPEGGNQAEAPVTPLRQTDSVYFKNEVVTMTPASTKKLKLKGATAKIKWSSSKKSVASVDSKGMVTAKKKGTAVIKAKHKKKTYTCTVNVIYGNYTSADGMNYTDVSGSFTRTGRWYKKKIGGGNYYFTGTEGSAFYFKVIGSRYVNLDFITNTVVSKPYFAYSVDGGEMKRQKITKKKIDVGNTKTHYVRVVIDAMSEKENRWEGEAGVGIKSVKPVTSSGVVTAIKPQNKIIAFYGDSITQGVRTLSMALNPKGTSATHSFAWHCAEKLKMIPYYAGFGGSGIIEPGGFNNCGHTITNFSINRKASSFEADVIVVEHGTNDVKYFGDGYLAEYKNVLNKLHKAHPKAKIFLMVPFTQIHAEDVRKAAASYKKWCTVVETSSWKISYTDGLHPNVTGSKTVGMNLAKKIKAKRKAS